MATRGANIASIIESGTFPSFDPGRRRETSLPCGAILYAHQEEVVQRMAEMEARGGLEVTDIYASASARKRKARQTMVSNIGMLCEPPGSGATTAVMCHLRDSPRLCPETSEFIRLQAENEERITKSMCLTSRHVFRTNSLERDPRPISFVDADVIVCSPRGIPGMASLLQQYDIPFLLLARHSDLDSLLAHDMSTTRAILLHSSLHGAFSQRVTNLMFGRLLYDWAGVLELSQGDIKSVFVWAVDSNPHNLLSEDARGGERRRDAAAKSRGHIVDTFCQSLWWIQDPSPFVVRHSRKQVMESMSQEAPSVGIYMSRSRQPYYKAEVVAKRPNEEAATWRLLVQYDAQVSRDVDSFSRSLPCQKVRNRVAEDSATPCPICMEDDSFPKVVLRCCEKLVCAPCACIMLTKGGCPYDRMPIRDMCVLGAKKPLNVTRVRRGILSEQTLGISKQSSLAHVVHTFREGPRAVVLFISEFDMQNYNNGLGIMTFLSHLGFIVYRLRGNYVSSLKNAETFQRGVCAFTPSRRALLAGPGTNLNGCFMDCATDVVFYTVPSDQEYAAVMGRVQTPACPGLERGDRGIRLRVHFLLTEKETLPAAVDVVGRGGVSSEYECKIARDVASFHVDPVNLVSLVL